MKPLLFAASMMLLLTSCDIVIVEPAYDYRDGMVGYYELEEYSQTYDEYLHYEVYVGEESNSRRAIYISNFYGAGITVDGYLDNSTVTIPWQTVDGYEVEGSGTFYGSELTLNFSVKDRYENTRRDYCEAWGTRER